MPRLAPNNARLTGQQFRQFRNALIDAYGAPGPFAEMLMFSLTKKLPTLTTANGMDQIVFDVILKAEDEAWTLELLQGARENNPKNPELVAFAEPFGLAPRVYEQSAGQPTSSTPMQGLALQKFIVESNGLKDVMKWRELLGTLEAQVCRIEIATGTQPQTGTGFLLGPRAVLTNFHVVELVQQKVVPPSAVTVRFDYKQLADGLTVNPGTEYHLAEDWLIDCSPFSPQDWQGGEPQPDELDYALLRLEGEAGNDPVGGANNPNISAQPRGWIKPPAAAPAIQPNTPLFILQHPKGAPLKLALDTNAIIEETYQGRRLRYRTNTEEGSSGSPCFDDNWNLVALHHLGDPAFNPGTKPLFNQGVPIKAILDLLKARGRTAEIAA
jgi:hypothetical protein